MTAFIYEATEVRDNVAYGGYDSLNPNSRIRFVENKGMIFIVCNGHKDGASPAVIGKKKITDRTGDDDNCSTVKLEIYHKGYRAHDEIRASTSNVPGLRTIKDTIVDHEKFFTKAGILFLILYML